MPSVPLVYPICKNCQGEFQNSLRTEQNPVIVQSLLLDEHTAALDPATAEKVLELTKKIVAENGITCLMITHNVQSALNLGNRTIMMKDGQIVMELSGQRRATITTEELLRAFQQQGLDNDRILFSAE